MQRNNCDQTLLAGGGTLFKLPVHTKLHNRCWAGALDLPWSDLLHTYSKHTLELCKWSQWICWMRWLFHQLVITATIHKGCANLMGFTDGFLWRLTTSLGGPLQACFTCLINDTPWTWGKSLDFPAGLTPTTRTISYGVKDWWTLKHIALTGTESHQRDID